MSPLEMIKKAVNAQAKDPAIWAMDLYGDQTVQEAYLQEALRDLHRVIESQDQQAYQRIMERAFDL